MAEIYYITKKDIDNKNTLFNFIYPNKDLNYYISDDFSSEFYIKLAKAGFISVSDYLPDNKQYLFPEMQFEYAVLDFENLHISKKVKKLLNKADAYSFSINEGFEEVLEKISDFHKDNWIRDDYLELLKNIKKSFNDENFELISVELRSCEGELIAGEIGYKIFSTYTSLSGFSNREYNNYGKLQMVLLAKYLEDANYSFWNMGHPYMQYKLDLGAKVLEREEFLERWLDKIKL